MAGHAKREKMSKNRATYDSKEDILFIHSGFSKDERFKTNIEAGGLILDVSTKRRVRGIEILDASAFLRDFGVTHELLSEMTGAEFSASMRQDGISIGLLIRSKSSPEGIPARIVTVREHSC